MNLFLSFPWRHTCENVGIASVILNLGTLATLPAGERASETHSARGWLHQKPVLMSTERGYAFKDNTS
jgi:hypothetical protein